MTRWCVFSVAMCAVSVCVCECNRFSILYLNVCPWGHVIPVSLMSLDLMFNIFFLLVVKLCQSMFSVHIQKMNMFYVRCVVCRQKYCVLVLWLKTHAIQMEIGMRIFTIDPQTHTQEAFRVSNCFVDSCIQLKCGKSMETSLLLIFCRIATAHHYYRRQRCRRCRLSEHQIRLKILNTIWSDKSACELKANNCSFFLFEMQLLSIPPNVTRTKMVKIQSKLPPYI